MKLTARDIEIRWPLHGVRLVGILQRRGQRVVGEVATAEEKFIYKIADESKRREHVEQDLAALQYLEARGFAHAPKLLSVRGGRLFATINDRHVYLLEKIEGKQAENTPEDWRHIGELTGELHQFVEYPVPTNFTVASVLPELRGFAEKSSFGSEYLQLVKQLPDFSNLPQTLIHTDTGLTNVLKTPDNVYKLVDWDDAGRGPRVLDPAFPLICYFINAKTLAFYELQARAFFTGYNAKIQLTQAEKDALFLAGLFYALMYIGDHDAAQNWSRIKWALQHRAEIVSTIEGKT